MNKYYAKLAEDFFCNGCVVDQEFFESVFMNALHEPLDRKFRSNVDCGLHAEFTSFVKSDIAPWRPPCEDFSYFDSVGHDFNRRLYTSGTVDEVCDHLMFGLQRHSDGKVSAVDSLGKFEAQAIHFPKLVDGASLDGHCWPPDDFSVYRNMP